LSNWGQVVILVIAVMLILTIPNSAYAVEVILPPQASDKAREAIAVERVQILQIGNMRLEFRPLYVVADDPALHEVPPGGTLDGVGDLIISIPGEGTFRCTASLLHSGIHVLTAAHCVTDAAGNFVPGTTANITFEAAPNETIAAVVSPSSIHPDYRGDFLCGNDIAVLELVSPASDSVDRYDIDRDGTDDVGSITNKVGYGWSGLGDTGDTIPSGTKREGMNLYDALADTMLLSLSTPFTQLSDTKCDPAVNDFVPGSVLQYDFDNGLVANDGFDFFFGIADLGLGVDEVKSSGGDSGGPSFGSPVITGVTSYGVRLANTGGPPPRTSDVDNTFNDSFGEFAGDTRVSFYAAFVDSIVPAKLTLSLTPSSISENAGAAASSGTVTRTGDITSSQLVNLASSDTSEATVPATVTIPTSQASVTFPINAVDDTLLDGTQTVTITASCPECISDNTSLDVTDNDIPIFSEGSSVSSSTGGIVEDAESDASITIPPGTLAGDTTFTIDALVSCPVPPGSLIFSSVCVDFNPDGTIFSLPGATLTLPLDFPHTPGTVLGLLKFNEISGSFENTGIVGIVDPGGLTATASGITSLSVYVLNNFLIIGGEGIPIDTTALLVAGFKVNATWMLPAMFLATVIGIIFFKKLKN